MLKKISFWYKKDKKIIIASVLAGIFFTIGYGLYESKNYSDRIQGDISNQVIRFHVKANSNYEHDQQLKIAVKEKVLDTFAVYLNEAETIEDTRNFLQKNIENIKICALEEIRRQGYDYTVDVSLTKDIFPTKTYGDISIPSGEYEALRIDIGNAEGNNWWCVMFPPLCYVDITHENLTDETKDKFKNLLAEEEYELISINSSSNPELKIKFKIVEWWQNQKINEDNNNKIVKK